MVRRHKLKEDNVIENGHQEESMINEDNSVAAKNPNATSSIETSIQNQFNELKREYLNTRSNFVNRLLVFICIVLVFFTIAIPTITAIAAYFAYVKFEEAQTQMQNRLNDAKNFAITAEKSANESAESLKVIKEHQAKIKVIVSKLTSKDFSNPTKASILNTTLQDIIQNPDLTLEDRATLEAYKLQSEGKITEAIEKWRSIADTAKGKNNDLVARAFFSIGYLHNEQNEKDQALSAYDQCIELMPTFADAYTARGVLNSALEKHEDAIVDHSEAIRLKPDFAEAFLYRGIAKLALENHEDAIFDFDEAIRLNLNFAVAYMQRGVSKSALKKHKEAVIDYDEAIRLNPNFADAYMNRSAAKRALNQMDAALEDMEKALELDKEQEKNP